MIITTSVVNRARHEFPLVCKVRTLGNRVYRVAKNVFEGVRKCRAASRVFAALKVIPGINAVLSVVESGESAASTLKSVKIGDKEGIALGLGGAGLAVGEVLDDGLTFLGGLRELASVTLPAVLELIDIPLGMLLCAGSTVLNSYKVHQMRCFENEVKKLGEENIEAALRPFLEKFVGSKGTSHKELKKLHRRLKRRCGGKMANKLNELSNLMNRKDKLSDGDKLKALEILSSVKLSVKRRIPPKFVKIFLAVLTIAALSLFFTPLGPLVPLCILAFVALAKLVTYIYEHFFADRGIKEVDLETNDTGRIE